MSNSVALQKEFLVFLRCIFECSTVSSSKESNGHVCVLVSLTEMGCFHSVTSARVHTSTMSSSAPCSYFSIIVAVGKWEFLDLAAEECFRVFQSSN